MMTYVGRNRVRILAHRYSVGMIDVMIFCVLTPLSAIFQLYHGGRSRSTWRERPTMGKQLVIFITCAASRAHPFCNLQSRARTHAVLVIGLYELLGNPTT
jgi:hypothetical protein